MVQIRPARPEDAAAIRNIWNPVIRESPLTFTSVEKSLEEIAAAIDPARWRVIEAERVLGFAAFGRFREGPGYRQTAELSIYLAPEAQGAGHGRRLLETLEVAAREAGIHVLVAGIAAENRRAIRFHAAAGYAETARMPEVGRKFGRWHDLVLMQKRL